MSTKTELNPNGGSPSGQGGADVSVWDVAQAYEDAQLEAQEAQGEQPVEKVVYAMYETAERQNLDQLTQQAQNFIRDNVTYTPMKVREIETQFGEQDEHGHFREATFCLLIDITDMKGNTTEHIKAHREYLWNIHGTGDITEYKEVS